MPREAVCLEVPKKQGQAVIVLASKLGIVDEKLEIQRDEKTIYVPLLNKPPEDALAVLKKKVPECKITAHVFPEMKKQQGSLVDLLAPTLPTHLLASLPHSADIVGDIAIIELTQGLEQYMEVIGKAVMKANKNVRTVLAKASAVTGTYRLRDYTVIAGETKTETVHKEYGCRYYVDVAKAYYSPRLSNEHNRIADLVKEGETVTDLFAGVGPFAVKIAKSHNSVKVYAIDINPDAVEYLKRNIRLNRVDEKVHALLGDARQIIDEKLGRVADRVIMNLPEKAIEFVDVACAAIKPQGGTVHFYGFVSDSEPLENMKRHFSESVERSGRTVDSFLFSRLVRATAPHEWQAVLDARIK
jgi:tRNA (guanine37-N1)-methyltransferase